MTAIYNSANPYMPSRPTPDTWDFSEVRELLNKLSTPSPAAKQQDPIASYGSSLPVQQRAGNEPSAIEPEKDTKSSGLGDLKSVWDFLGVDANAPALELPATVPVTVPTATSAPAPASTLAPVPAPVTLEPIQDREAYASDGAIDCPPSSKSIKWRDEVDGQEIADPPQEAPPETPLTKAQRKKLRRKQAQRERQEKLKSTSDAESENDVQETPARKASVHTLSNNAQPSQQTRYNLRPRTAPPTPTTKPVAAQLSADLASLLSQPKSKALNPPEQAKATESKKPEQPAQPQKSGQTVQPKPPAQVVPKTAGPAKPATPATPATPKTKPSRSSNSPQKNIKVPTSVPSSAPVTPFSQQLQHLQQAKIGLQQPFFTPGPAPVSPGAIPYLVPYYVNPEHYAFLAAQSLSNPRPSHVSYNSQPLLAQTQLPAQAQVQAQVQAAPTPATQQPQKLALRQGADRHYHFLLKVIRNFGEDMKWLVSPAQSKDHNTSPTGIHVFVDASNILIGFYERLKYAKGIPKSARMQRPEFDFDALVLLLERRRPVAKRVLAGSNPYVPTFEKANSIGYELNILDKVKKAKELTERQKFFQQRDAERSRARRGSHSHSGKDATTSGGSGSETTAPATASQGPVFAPEKWVEQGVDEILHLKILESVVDVDEPSTIVLATGDAAEAEYSAGFLKMVERALRKGWRVEVVAWAKSISFAYREKKFVERWGDRFRIIELDDYVEDLLDV